MARAKIEFLLKEDIDKINRKSLEVLSKIGVKIQSGSTIELLEKAGATRSSDGKRILIGEEMVKAALSSSPKSILLAALDRQLDIKIPTKGKIYAATGGTGAYIKNLFTGEIRTSTANDLRDIAIISDEMSEIDYFWPLVSPMDQPIEIKGVIEIEMSFAFTRKHVQGESMTGDEARKMIELASMLVGGEEALTKRPIFSCVQCPISPLTFEKGLVEAQVELSKAGIPVVAMTASLAGLTSPITIAGTLVQLNAENLASLVISQTARKGAPFIYSSDSSPANLHTGGIDYQAMESPLIRTAAAQMGKYYNLPTMSAVCSIENVSLTMRSISEGIPLLLHECLIPSDLASGIGGIDDSSGGSFEQTVVDAWIWDATVSFARNFEFDDESIALDTIREAAMDGSYLNKRHTMMRFKKELCSVQNGEAHIGWMEDDGDTPGLLLKEAKLEVERILKARKNKPWMPNADFLRMEEFIRNAKENI